MKNAKLWLAVSLAVNVFLIGALAAGLWFTGKAVDDRRRGSPLFVAAQTLSEADQAILREDMHVAAREARPNFRAAREARRRAVQLAAAPEYDAAATLAALREASAAEARGKDVLDTHLTQVLTRITPEARKTISPALEHSRRGKGRHKDRGDRGPDGPPPPAGPPPESTAP